MATKFTHKKKREKEFKSSLGLTFGDGGPFWADPTFRHFKIGTCTGLYFAKDKSYEILAIVNGDPGNGHLDDVFEWFERSCRRDEYSLKVIEFMNDRFRKHLIEKRGFVPYGENVIKFFTSK